MALFHGRGRHDCQREPTDMRDLTYAQSRRPSAEDLRRPAPQLQVPLVAPPRNQLNRHEKVARFWRPFRLLGSSQHSGQIASQLDSELAPQILKAASDRQLTVQLQSAQRRPRRKAGTSETRCGNSTKPRKRCLPSPNCA